MNAQATRDPAPPPSLDVQRFLTYFGAGFALVYAAGFMVSNTYLGAVWLVDPSLLQARYASTGLLWLAFLLSTALPPYYLLKFWRDIKEPGDSESEPEPSQPDPGAMPNRLTSFAKTTVRLTGLVVVLLTMLLIFVGPFYPFAVLFAVGVHPFDAVVPVLGFYAATIAVTVLFATARMTLHDTFDFRSSPHRAVSWGTLVLLHAVFFGHLVYPVVPASMGGGRPLPVSLVLAPDFELPGILGRRGSREIAGAYVVSSTTNVLVTLLPLSTSTSDEQAYCAVALQHDVVRAAVVQPSYLPWAWNAADFSFRRAQPLLWRVRPCS